MDRTEKEARLFYINALDVLKDVKTVCTIFSCKKRLWDGSFMDPSLSMLALCYAKVSSYSHMVSVCAFTSTHSKTGSVGAQHLSGFGVIKFNRHVDIVFSVWGDSTCGFPRCLCGFRNITTLCVVDLDMHLVRIIGICCMAHIYTYVLFVCWLKE